MVGEVVVFGHIINSFLSKTQAITISNLTHFIAKSLILLLSIKVTVLKNLKIGETYYIRHCLILNDCITL